MSLSGSKCFTVTFSTVFSPSSREYSWVSREVQKARMFWAFMASRSCW